MSVRGLDHWAITVASIERTIAFYRGLLGCEVLYEDLWRRGTVPIVSLCIGANVINVHEAGSEASPHAEKPTPGSADFCMRWDAPLEEAVALLEAKGIAIIEGPVPRPAADGEAGRSVYFRDPDDNLVEFLSTVAA
ncbi:MAG: VOC family protein [Deltaproteobacteria bacterium]|nr:VOC family protein [Deltaproteobacteria bacterium]MBW2360034.1 VOC family protein [Deltaproteobacteria bacterium]